MPRLAACGCAGRSRSPPCPAPTSRRGLATRTCLTPRRRCGLWSTRSTRPPGRCWPSWRAVSGGDRRGAAAPRPGPRGAAARGRPGGRAGLWAADAAGRARHHQPAAPGCPRAGQPATPRGQARRSDRRHQVLELAAPAAGAAGSRCCAGRLAGCPAVGAAGPGAAGLGVPAVLPRSGHRPASAAAGQRPGWPVRRPLLGEAREFGVAEGAEFAQLAWPAGLRPPGAAGAPPTPRHGVPVVGVCELGVVVAAAVVLGTVPAGAVVVGTATGAVVVGTATVVGTDRDGEVVDAAGARLAGGAGLSAPATTTPTDVLAPCRGRLPNKLASGCRATASMPVIAPPAIPNASTAATATRRQRIGSGCALLAPSSRGPASSPTRRRRERRASVSADASVRVYTASAGVTRMLPSAAPMRVPSTPKNDATTAPVTAASAPASNLGTRSCSIPHLHVGVGGRRRCRGWPQARPDGSPAAPARARILPTEAVSRQVVPGQAGDRAAWESCSAGYQVFIAEVLQRAEFKGAQGPEGPKVAHDDPAHVGPRRVHQSQRGCALSARRAEILLGGQESCSSMRACRARWLSRDNARAALSNALTNSRQIQHGKHPPG